jgi:hypothetical protein
VCVRARRHRGHGARAQDRPLLLQSRLHLLVPMLDVVEAVVRELGTTPSSTPGRGSAVGTLSAGKSTAARS